MARPDCARKRACPAVHIWRGKVKRRVGRFHQDVCVKLCVCVCEVASAISNQTPAETKQPKHGRDVNIRSPHKRCDREPSRHGFSEVCESTVRKPQDSEHRFCCVGARGHAWIHGNGSHDGSEICERPGPKAGNASPKTGASLLPDFCVPLCS